MASEQLRIPYELPDLSPCFTPGDWSCSSDPYSAPVLMVSCADGLHPAHESRPLKEKQANAALWARAPELFRELHCAAVTLLKLGMFAEAEKAFSVLQKAAGDQAV